MPSTEQFVACRARPVSFRACVCAGSFYSFRFDESVRRIFAVLCAAYLADRLSFAGSRTAAVSYFVDVRAAAFTLAQLIMYVSVGRPVYALGVVTERINFGGRVYLSVSVCISKNFIAVRTRIICLRAVFNAGGLHSVRLDESVRGIFAVLESLRALFSAGA